MSASKNKKISPFIEWKKELQYEDVVEFGHVVSRPDSAYQVLYEIYRKQKSEEKNKIK